MPNAYDAISQKSTNVHSKKMNLAQRSFRQVSRWAPAAAERLALRMFMTPSRALRRTAPRIPGLRATRVKLRSRPYRLRVWEWGHGPAVLLVHGWSGQAGQWSAFAKALVGAGYRVLVVDLPAHGFSSGRTATLPDFVRAVRTVGTYAGPLHAVIGHSLGGTASTLAIAAGMDAQRAVLIAPPTHVPYFLKRLADWLGLSPASYEGLVRRIVRVAGVPLETLDLRNVSPLMETPVLILHSRRDREVPFEHGQDVAKLWPGAQLIAIESNSHTRILTQPDVIAAAVGFVRGADDRSDESTVQRAGLAAAAADDGDRIAFSAAL